MSKRVLVCGGRDFRDKALLFSVLDRIAPTEVIHGGANGADYLADRWCQERGVGVTEFRARWREEGRAAGPRRNERMLVERRPDVVVAFPGGRGTADMVRRARAAGVEVVEITGDAE